MTVTIQGQAPTADHKLQMRTAFGLPSTEQVLASIEATKHIYAGTFTSDPLTRPDGSAVQAGDYAYINGLGRQWTGAVWQASDINTANLAASGGAGLVGANAYQTQDAVNLERVSVKRFGAKGDGINDDTAAIQAAINYSALTGAEITMPPGNYIVTAGLVYASVSAGNGFCLRGTGSGFSKRSIIKWRGVSATAVVLNIKGGYYCNIENLVIQQENTAQRYFGAIFLQENNSTGGSPSTGCKLSRLSVSGGAGAESYAIRLGHNNFQMSEVTCREVVVMASNDGVNHLTNYGFVIGYANTKNMEFYYCQTGFFTIAGVKYEQAASGFHSWFNFSGAQNKTDFEFNDGSIMLIGGASEGSKRFLNQVGGGGNPATVSVRNFSFAGIPSTMTSGLAISLLGCDGTMLTLDSCVLKNVEDNVTPLYIGFGAGTLTASGGRSASFASRGCFYQNATVLPVVDVLAPTLPLVSNNYNGNYLGNKVRISSMGDSGRFGGALIPLSPILGQVQRRFESKAVAGYNYAITRGLQGYSAAVPAIAPTVHKYTIPYTALVDNNQIALIGILDIAARGKITAVYTQVTEAFAIAGTTVSMAVGIGSVSDTGLILPHDISTTNSKGNAAADLGALLAPATAAQGGYLNMTGSLTVRAKIYAATNTPLGNGTVTNCTAGSVDIYVVVQDLT